MRIRFSAYTAGLSLIQDLRREAVYAIGVDPDGDKIMRMAAQTAPIEAGAVHLPVSTPWLDDFKKESCHFPRVSMTTKSMLCRKPCSVHSPQNQRLR